MLQRRTILLLGGSLLLLASLAALTVFRHREPRYQGRSLSSWLYDVGIRNRALEAQAATINAVRNMGPDAYPLLIQWLKAKDGPVRQRVLATLGRQRCLRLGLLTADEKQWKARLTLSSLGTNGAVAWKQILLDPDSNLGLRMAAISWCQTLPEDAPQIIPSALRLMADVNPDEREGVRWAIGRFGPDVAIPVLINQLQEPDHKIQLMSMRAIKFFGYKGKPATAPLVQQLKSSDEELGLGAADTLLSLDAHNLPALLYRMHHGELSKRTTAYWILTHEELPAAFAIPEILRGLTDTEPEIRRAAAEGLATYGTNAQPALPALTNLFSDSKRYVRLAATNAVTNIMTQQ